MSTREILNKTIKDSQSVIDEAKSKLAELDKPDMVNGEYGISCDGRPYFYTGNGIKAVAHFADGTSQPHGKWQNGKHLYPTMGIIFDDIKNKGKELAEFEIETQCHTDIAVRICNSDTDCIVLEKTDEDAHFNITQAQDFCDKWQQVINKAKNNK